MSKLYFMNKGYFDKRAMMTFGLNVKEGDNNIGFFGTGFKYAVAIILRNSGKISVTTKAPGGEIEIITFTSVIEEIRGKEFGMVKMNGADAGFTTHLGINWEHWQHWQAYRELYTNCIDEDGEVSDSLGEAETVVYVDCQAIFDAWYNQSIYFITGEPAYEDDQVQVFNEMRPYFYYQGIAVATIQGDALFSYNIKSHVQLTEDRTAKYMHEITGPIETCFFNMTDTDLLGTALACKEHFEAKLDFPDYITPSDEFIKTVEHLRKTDRGVNASASQSVKRVQQRKGDYLGLPLSPTYQQMLAKAIVFLKGMHITIEDFEIIPSQGMGDSVMGRALRGKIYISEMAFQLGTKQVASTLLEEWLHIKLSTPDFSRKMQNWLFDRILTMAEEINGEPL